MVAVQQITSAFVGDGIFNSYTNSTVVSPQGQFTVSIAGRWYGIDSSYEAFRRDAFKHTSIPAQRESINLTNISGEGTVNTDGLWRREQNDWSSGSGQLFLDRKESKENRFYRSKGVNPWKQWQLTLLQDTIQQTGFGGTIIKAISVNQYVYVATSTGVYYTSNLSLWTNVSSVTNILDITSNGRTVYFATATQLYQTTVATSSVTNVILNTATTFSANVTNNSASLTNVTNLTNLQIGNFLSGTGIASGATITSINAATATVGMSLAATTNVALGSVTSTPFNSSPSGITSISWQLDHLFVACGPLIGYVNASNAYQPIWTNPNPNWVWSSFSSCSGAVYLGGYTGSGSSNANGAVYYTIFTPGTPAVSESFSVPIVALPMSIGEYPTALFGMYNFLLIGTNLGIRLTMAVANSLQTSANYLTSGPLLPSVAEPVTYPVTGITGNGRFVWFSWNNYDGASTGLGRLDLTNFIDTLSPAYASDLMIPWTSGVQTGIVLDWDPINNAPLMTLKASSVNQLWTQNNNLQVTSGTVDSGRITFGIPDNKIVTFGHINTNPSKNNVSMYISTDGSVSTLEMNQVAPQTSGIYPVNPALNGEYFNVQMKLTGPYSSSTLNRYTIYALPAIATETMITQVIQLYDVVSVNGIDYTYDPYLEYLYLDTLRREQSIISYLEGPLSANVVIHSLTWIPYERRDNFYGGYRGNLIVTMKTINGMTLNQRPSY